MTLPLLLAVAFLIELIGLFLLSHTLTRLLSLVLVRITRSYPLTIHILAFLFLPGVIIHELAHMLVASMLFVHTGHIEFIPQIKGDHVKLGSVAIGHTDPIRRFLIGVAPVVIGLAVIFASFLFYFSFAFVIPQVWKIVILLYILFEVGNTMYSSRKDMEGAIAFLMTICVICAFLIFIFRPSLLIILQPLIIGKQFFQTMDIILAIIVGIDIAVCFLARNVLRKITH